MNTSTIFLTTVTAGGEPAVCLLIDTGIHARRWSFIRTVDFLTKASSLSVNEAQGEITRYSDWPG